jgi:hypothetical protein
MAATNDFQRARPAATLSALLWLGAVGCADDSVEPIVGSGDVVESTTEADVIEKVEVWLPFRAQVGNGEPKKLVLRGEDNLLDEITVEEIAVGEWRIEAPPDLDFVQHEDIEVEVPYIDMVVLELKGDDIVIKDHPAEVWNDAGADGG